MGTPGIEALILELILHILSKLIHKILIEQSNSEITLERFRSGYDLAKSKKKYAQLNKRIEKVVDEYIYIPHVEYLRAISHNLS